jgi:hypothetical protein
MTNPFDPAAVQAKLVTALRAYVYAQSRMLEKWAEGNDVLRRDLWRNLHDCEDAGRAALEDADVAGILAMSDEEILADARARGIDVEQNAAEMRQMFEATVRLRAIADAATAETEAEKHAQRLFELCVEPEDMIAADNALALARVARRKAVKGESQ